MSLRFEYQVQVSRMMPVLSGRRVNVVGGKTFASSPHVGAHSSLLPMRNSKHRSIYTFNTHLTYSGAANSLLPPRHRCYALLSSVLSRLVRESRRNSYQPR